MSGERHYTIGDTHELRSLLVRVARGRLRDRSADAEDVAHDTIVSLLGTMGRDGFVTESYAVSSTVNRCHSYYRKLRREREGFEVRWGAPPGVPSLILLELSTAEFGNELDQRVALHIVTNPHCDRSTLCVEFQVSKATISRVLKRIGDALSVQS